MLRVGELLDRTEWHSLYHTRSIPGEKTSTRVESAKSLYARIPEAEAREGVLDAAIWIGYAWADEPRCHVTVVVTGDDEAVTAAATEELGRDFWDVRDRDPVPHQRLR